MYSWLGFSQDKLNDVVLTSSYVAKLLVQLSRVNMNSYVWDFATEFRVIIMTEANSQGNIRDFRLLPKLKTKKLSGWCVV